MAALGMTRDPVYVAAVEGAFFRAGETGDFEAMAPGLVALFSTYFIKKPTFDFAAANANLTETSFYSLEHDGTRSLYQLLLGSSSSSSSRAVEIPGGVTHGDDLVYLFSIPTLTPDARSDLRVSREMVALWTGYAYGGRFGGATPIGSRSEGGGGGYLKIDASVPTVERDFPMTYNDRP